MKSPSKASIHYKRCLQGRNRDCVHSRGSAWRQVKVQGLPATPTQAEASASLWGAFSGSQFAAGGGMCSPAHPASGPAHLSPVLPLWQPHFAQEKSSKPASSGALPVTPPGDTAKENQSTLFSKLEPGAIPVRHAWLNGAVCCL